jgi:predicted Zn-dependent protease
MSWTLTLISAGWESVRRAVASGRRGDAVRNLHSLLKRPDLPADIAVAANTLCGELELESCRFREARRRFRAAAALSPTCARTFFLWGKAFENDPEGCDRRAAARFRLACKLEPENLLYRAAFGRAAIRCGHVKAGVRIMSAAAKASPGDLKVLAVVVEGLLEAGQTKTANRIVQQARFLNPNHTMIQGLQERVQFEVAGKKQRKLGRITRHRHDADFAREGGRVILPFIRLVGSDSVCGNNGGSARRDRISIPRPHFNRLGVRRADR